jgi:hypothetical protein
MRQQVIGVIKSLGLAPARVVSRAEMRHAGNS